MSTTVEHNSGLAVTYGTAERGPWVQVMVGSQAVRMRRAEWLTFLAALLAHLESDERQAVIGRHD